MIVFARSLPRIPSSLMKLPPTQTQWSRNNRCRTRRLVGSNKSISLSAYTLVDAVNRITWCMKTGRRSQKKRRGRGGDEERGGSRGGGDRERGGGRGGGEGTCQLCFTSQETVLRTSNCLETRSKNSWKCGLSLT